MSLLIVFISKIIIFILRFFKIGGGTTLPGLLVEKYYPRLLKKFSKRYKKIILITGTNGKTTTQQLLRHLLESEDKKVVSNISGANLVRGIASAIIQDVSLVGKIESQIAVFEVEEASMPIIAKHVDPDFVVVTNLFRDQLDVYGEILQTRKYILEAIKRCKNAKLILNKDDANVASIANDLNNSVRYFYVDDERSKQLYYEREYFDIKPNKSPKNCYAKNVELKQGMKTNFDVQFSRKKINDLSLSTPGLQNIYCAIAAVSVLCEITDCESQSIRHAFKSFKPAFGRGEKITVNNKNFRILLVKNPSSFTANLQMLKNISKLKLFIIINDNIADGRDVSWLWDADLSTLKKADLSWMSISGTRAYDMKLRCKYAGLEDKKIETEINLRKAFDISNAKLKEDETLFILPTYTAMLQIRKLFRSISNIKNFWEK